MVIPNLRSIQIVFVCFVLVDAYRGYSKKIPYELKKIIQGKSEGKTDKTRVVPKFSRRSVSLSLIAEINIVVTPLTSAVSEKFMGNKEKCFITCTQN